MLTAPVVIISLIFTLSVVLVTILLVVGKKGKTFLEVLVPVLSLTSFLMVSWASYISMENSIITAKRIGLDSQQFGLNFTQRKLAVIQQLITLQEDSIDCHQLIATFGFAWRPKWVPLQPVTNKNSPLSCHTCCMAIAQLVEDYLTYRDVNLHSDAELASFFAQFAVSQMFLQFITDYQSMYQEYTCLYISALSEHTANNQWQNETDLMTASSHFVTTDRFLAIIKSAQKE